MGISNLRQNVMQFHLFISIYSFKHKSIQIKPDWRIEKALKKNLSILSRSKSGVNFHAPSIKQFANVINKIRTFRIVMEKVSTFCTYHQRVRQNVHVSLTITEMSKLYQNVRQIMSRDQKNEVNFHAPSNNCTHFDKVINTYIFIRHEKVSTFKNPPQSVCRSLLRIIFSRQKHIIYTKWWGSYWGSFVSY